MKKRVVAVPTNIICDKPLQHKIKMQELLCKATLELHFNTMLVVWSFVLDGKKGLCDTIRAN